VRFISAVTNAAKVRHHADTRLGAQMYRREQDAHLGQFEPHRAWFDEWKIRGRYVGPCSSVLEIFRSMLVDDKDLRDGVDLWEFRYPTTEESARVASLLRTSWDWNYHPFSVLQDGRNVLVIEGRHRAPGSVIRIRDYVASIAPPLSVPDRARDHSRRR
jgi:hypothetical protein